MTETLDLKGIDVVCKEGVSHAFYERVRPWLDGKEGRRLFFVEDCEEKLRESIANDPRVKTFFLETPLQKEIVAKKIGHLAAFKELLVVGDDWKEMIEAQHILAQTVASDAADFGLTVFQHLKANFKKPIRSIPSGSMKGVPAVIIGAGPSLEKNGHLLREWKDKALLIATGSAIQSMDVEPDLAIALDPHLPVMRKRFGQVPLCLQSRMHPDNWRGVTGEALYLPDSHFAFESWLTNSTPIDAGWTAGTAGVAVAKELGCDPIILIGMDYCYRGEQKYAGQKPKASENPLVKAYDAEGKKVLTQRDWLLAIRWLEQFAQESGRLCLNATIGGMAVPGFGSMREIDLSQDVSARWKAVVSSGAPVVLDEERLKDWAASLKRCYRNIEAGEMVPLEGEIAQELLLEPLWNIWAPLFERELMSDKEPIALQEKLAIQKILFFNQVIEEYAKDN